MTTIDGFEDALRESLMDAAEEEAAAMRDDLADDAEANWKSYAAANGYDIGHIWEDAERAPVRRRGRNRVTTSVTWPGLTGLFEYGVGPHVIEGNPYLAFTWESPPQGTRPPGAPRDIVTDKVNWGSVTGGIPASRAIRDALDGLAFAGGDA